MNAARNTSPAPVVSTAVNREPRLDDQLVAGQQHRAFGAERHAQHAVVRLAQGAQRACRRRLRR